MTTAGWPKSLCPPKQVPHCQSCDMKAILSHWNLLKYFRKLNQTAARNLHWEKSAGIINWVNAPSTFHLLMGMFRARGEPRPGKCHLSYKDGLCRGVTSWITDCPSLWAFLTAIVGWEQTAFSMAAVSTMVAVTINIGGGEWDWNDGALSLTPPTLLWGSFPRENLTPLPFWPLE